MLGFTNNEGIIWDTVPLVKSQEPQDAHPEETVLLSFNITNADLKTEIAKQIEHFYYKNDHSSVGRLGRIKHAGDAWILWEVLKSAKAHAKIEDQDLYLYMFSADTKLNYFKRLHPITAKVEGASHGDDLGYVFKTKYTPDMKPGIPEWNAMENVIKLWTNFAKYGNPTPEFEEFYVTWKPVKDQTLNYLDIGTKSLTMKSNPFHERMTFWNNLEEKYAKGREIEEYVHSEL